MEETRKNPTSLIKATFQKAIETLANNYQGSSLTDIFVVVDKESGEVAFYDDEENKVDELTDETVAAVLRDVTVQLDNDNMFTALDLYKPFSVNYSDDNFLVIEELLQINEDSIVTLDNDLMEKFDREFDAFLEKLLKE